MDFEAAVEALKKFRDWFKNSNGCITSQEWLDNIVVDTFREFLCLSPDVGSTPLDLYQSIYYSFYGYIKQNQDSYKTSESYILSLTEHGLFSFLIQQICYNFICLHTRISYAFIMQFLPEKYPFLTPTFDADIIERGLKLLKTIFDFDDCIVCCRSSVVYILFGIVNLYCEGNSGFVDIFDIIVSRISNSAIIKDLFSLQKRATVYCDCNPSYKDSIDIFVGSCGYFISRIFMTKNGLEILYSTILELSCVDNLILTDNQASIKEEKVKLILHSFVQAICLFPQQCNSEIEYSNNISDQLVRMMNSTNSDLLIIYDITRMLLKNGFQSLKTKILVKIFSPITVKDTCVGHTLTERTLKFILQIFDESVSKFLLLIIHRIFLLYSYQLFTDKSNPDLELIRSKCAEILKLYFYGTDCSSNKILRLLSTFCHVEMSKLNKYSTFVQESLGIRVKKFTRLIPTFTDENVIFRESLEPYEKCLISAFVESLRNFVEPEDFDLLTRIIQLLQSSDPDMLNNALNW